MQQTLFMLGKRITIYLFSQKYKISHSNENTTVNHNIHKNKDVLIPFQQTSYLQWKDFTKRAGSI